MYTTLSQGKFHAKPLVVNNSTTDNAVNMKNVMQKKKKKQLPGHVAKLQYQHVVKTQLSQGQPQ